VGFGHDRDEMHEETRKRHELEQTPTIGDQDGVHNPLPVGRVVADLPRFRPSCGGSSLPLTQTEYMAHDGALVNLDHVLRWALENYNDGGMSYEMLSAIRNMGQGQHVFAGNSSFVCWCGSKHRDKQEASQAG
jgi:hypothetical protein